MTTDEVVYKEEAEESSVFDLINEECELEDV